MFRISVLESGRPELTKNPVTFLYVHVLIFCDGEVRLYASKALEFWALNPSSFMAGSSYE
jgi:hypothetical protein